MLGMLAKFVKSDLEIPAASKSFISLYLLFSIGFNGGTELAASGITGEVILSLIFGMFLAFMIPIYTFFILKVKLNSVDAGAIAASYGSVSAVTFVSSPLFLFAILMPIFNGCWVSFASQWLTDDQGNRLIFAVLAASASYIAVPAAMRIVAPKADPGIYIPMALGLTFPFNITIGMPLFFQIIHG